MARSRPLRPRTTLDRLIERRIFAASPQTLARYARLLSPKQTLRRNPGWSFAIPLQRDDLGTFTRRLIWQRYRDEKIDRPIQVEWCNGLRINLRLGNDLSWGLFVAGSYEPNELAFVAATLEPGMVFVDVGANDGLFTLVAAARVGKPGRVLAFEPSFREFERLRANIELNHLDNVESLRLALYSHRGTTQLVRAEFGHEGLNMLGDRIANSQVHAAGTEPVELETLDGLAIDQLDLLKIDAEGSEARILEGALATIRRLQPIILLEIAPDYLAAHGSTSDDLLALVADLGYRTWIFDSEGRPRPNADGAALSDNIIAAPKQWQPPNVP